MPALLDRKYVESLLDWLNYFGEHYIQICDGEYTYDIQNDMETYEFILLDEWLSNLEYIHGELRNRLESM